MPIAEINSRPILLAPSVLSADFARLGEQARAAQAAGADWLQIDVMDGVFVPNIVIDSCAALCYLRPVSDYYYDARLATDRVKTR